MNGLSKINQYAHLNYLHPNRMPWEEANTTKELQFLSLALVGKAEQEKKAVAYLYKELSQLAEIEMHVSTVMATIICELQAEKNNFNIGNDLYHAVSCFASEEIQHANSFYHYVRSLSGKDIKLYNNLFKDRINIYRENDSPLIKLAALCSTAYVGESVITVFEQHMKLLDPMQRYFFTKLLHYHGLDEERHIHFDHFVFDKIIPNLTSIERKRMHQLIQETEDLNTQLAKSSAEIVKNAFNLDYTEENVSAKLQLDITLRFRKIIQSNDLIQKLDENLDNDTSMIIKQFTNSPYVHSYDLTTK